jgi:hypothetical protein
MPSDERLNSEMNLRILLLVHAAVTFAAGVVLIAAPALIPKTVGIEIGPEQFLLSYFLGAAELGLAYLSFYARKINDRHALRIIVSSFIVFHLATGIVEIYALAQGVSPNLIANIALRIIVSVLFFYYGFYKNE